MNRIESCSNVSMRHFRSEPQPLNVISCANSEAVAKSSSVKKVFLVEIDQNP